MESIVQLYSDKPGEILNFLNKYFNDSNLKLSDELLWEKHYDNPIEIADIIINEKLIQTKESRMLYEGIWKIL